MGGESPAATLLLLLGALGYLAFVALYSIRLRDYSSMKAIFLLPGLLAFVAMLELGTARADAWSRTGLARALRPIAASILGLLLLGYAVDVGALIAHLARS